MDVEAIFFTLTLPMGGADKNILFSYLKILLPALPLMLILAYGYFRLLKHFSGEGRKRGIAYWILATAGIAYFFGALYYLEHRKKLISFLLAPREQSAMFEERYRPVQSGEVIFREKRNVVLLVLESIEESYNDEKRFGEKLMPRLAALRSANASFYGSRETRGADWTVGALTAYTLGLPLAFARESTTANYFGEASAAFLPGATSILKIFEDHGYTISFFLGSKKEFAGQDKLVGSHTRAASIYDLKYFEEKRQRGEIQYNTSNWGVPDSRIYAEAMDFLRKNQKEEPFLLIIQTVDTHIGDGNFNGPGKRKWGDLRDCVNEADQMASSFIAWLQEQSFYEDTVIVALGDHLLPLDRLGPVDLPERSQREPYNVFINAAFQNEAQRRDFAAFDLAPTILSAAGAKWPGGRLGLGVSLVEPEAKTLFEERGQKYYEEEVRKKSPFYESLFSVNF